MCESVDLRPTVHVPAPLVKKHDKKGAVDVVHNNLSR